MTLTTSTFANIMREKNAIQELSSPITIMLSTLILICDGSNATELQDEEEESELGMTELLALKEEKEKKKKEEEEMRKKKEEAEKEAQEEKERARGVSWGMEVFCFINFDLALLTVIEG